MSGHESSVLILFPDNDRPAALDTACREAVIVIAAAFNIAALMPVTFRANLNAGAVRANAELNLSK